MKEQIIKFETAKLAKKEGFDLKCDNWYRDTGELFGRNHKRGGLIPPVKSSINRQVAPSQSLLQKWLRENHNLFVAVGIYNKTYHYSIFWIHEDREYGGSNKDYDYYEEALEQGLKDALKLIKNGQNKID